MNESFGARLRLRREQQQITIAAIAERTKINPTLLHGLERDNVSQWPEGIFRRAYIRAYASAIGLDPDETMHEFLALHPDSVVVLPAGAAMWPEERSKPAAPPRRRFGTLVSTAIAAVPAILRRPGPSPAAASGQAAPAHDRRHSPDLSATADLCTRFAQVTDRAGLETLLADAAALMDAIGLVVWCSNARATTLSPALVHGYAEPMRAKLKAIPATAENAVGNAFRSSGVCVVEGDGVTGAVAVPMLGPRRCVGVLAVELPAGAERQPPVHALAAIVAAQLVATRFPARRPLQ